MSHPIIAVKLIRYFISVPQDKFKITVHSKMAHKLFILIIIPTIQVKLKQVSEILCEIEQKTTVQPWKNSTQKTKPMSKFLSIHFI